MLAFVFPHTSACFMREKTNFPFRAILTTLKLRHLFCQLNSTNEATQQGCFFRSLEAPPSHRIGLCAPFGRSRIRFAFAAKAVWELAHKRLGVRIFAQRAKFPVFSNIARCASSFFAIPHGIARHLRLAQMLGFAYPTRRSTSSLVRRRVRVYSP